MSPLLLVGPLNKWPVCYRRRYQGSRSYWETARKRSRLTKESVFYRGCSVRRSPGWPHIQKWFTGRIVFVSHGLCTLGLSQKNFISPFSPPIFCKTDQEWPFTCCLSSLPEALIIKCWCGLVAAQAHGELPNRSMANPMEDIRNRSEEALLI